MDANDAMGIAFVLNNHSQALKQGYGSWSYSQAAVLWG